MLHQNHVNDLSSRALLESLGESGLQRVCTGQPRFLISRWMGICCEALLVVRNAVPFNTVGICSLNSRPHIRESFPNTTRGSVGGILILDLVEYFN